MLGKDVKSERKCILTRAYEHSHARTHTHTHTHNIHCRRNAHAMNQVMHIPRAGQIHSRQPDPSAVARAQIPLAISSTPFYNGAHRAGSSPDTRIAPSSLLRNSSLASSPVSGFLHMVLPSLGTLFTLLPRGWLQRC